GGSAALPVQGRDRRVFPEAGRERDVRPHRPGDWADAAAGRAADHPPCERVDGRGGGDAADRYAHRGGVLPPRWDPALRAAADFGNGMSRAAPEFATNATRVQRPAVGSHHETSAWTWSRRRVRHPSLLLSGRRRKGSA